VILIRRLVGRGAAQQATIILATLDQVTEDLKAGAMVVIHEDTLRVAPYHIASQAPPLMVKGPPNAESAR
jgi:hypothetical protein